MRHHIELRSGSMPVSGMEILKDRKRAAMSSEHSVVEKDPGSRQSANRAQTFPREPGESAERPCYSVVYSAFWPISKLPAISSARSMPEWSQAFPPWAAQELNSSWQVAVLGSDRP